MEHGAWSECVLCVYGEYAAQTSCTRKRVPALCERAFTICAKHRLEAVITDDGRWRCCREVDDDDDDDAPHHLSYICMCSTRTYYT